MELFKNGKNNKGLQFAALCCDSCLLKQYTFINTIIN